MELNHDARKQQLNASIRKSSSISLIIAIIILISQIYSYGYKIVYTIRRQSDGSEMQSYFDILHNSGYGRIPDLIVKSLLTIGVLVLLILLFGGLRKNGLPFTKKNGRLMTIAGILQGLQAILPAAFWLVHNFPYDNSSEPSTFSMLFSAYILNYHTLGIGILLIFLS